MKLALNSGRWKRFFSVPCAVADNYLKLADGPALKVLLYMLSCEDEPEAQKIISATGISERAFEEAIAFWRELGVISNEEGEPAQVLSEQTEGPAPIKTPVLKPSRSSYTPKDIADELKTSPELKELFNEAEATLGRILRHSDHETLISLRDYYGFSEQSIVLILGYCADLGKTSARYYETVAKNLYDSGITDFHSIETEFERSRERYGFEAQIKREFGIDANLSKKQSGYISSWSDLGFGLDMISLAKDRCLDATNKISFAYIDKILQSWHEKGFKTPEAAESEQKPNKSGDGGFDWDEFDRFTLGISEKETK